VRDGINRRTWGSAQVMGLGLPLLDPAALRSMVNTTGEISLRWELECSRAV